MYAKMFSPSEFPDLLWGPPKYCTELVLDVPPLKAKDGVRASNDLVVNV
jgi:hypothetical protein